jgi:hypothetical protein
MTIPQQDIREETKPCEVLPGNTGGYRFEKKLRNMSKAAALANKTRISHTE